MKKYFLFLLLTFLLMPGGAYAAGLCCQLSSGVQESLLGAAAPVTGKVSLQLTYSISVMDTLMEGTHERSVKEVEDSGKFTSIPTHMEMNKYILTAAYGFSPRVKAFVSVPYVRNTMDMAHMGMMGWMEMSMEPVRGVGDITVMGIYRLYTDSDLKPESALSAGVGLKLPTGSYTKKTPSGSVIHAHMQPGTGSWDPILALIYTRKLGQFLLQSDLTYQITTENSKGYEFGDSFTANVGGKYALFRFLNVTGDLIYLNTGKSEDEKNFYFKPGSLMDDPANTGGQSIWVSPGIEILPVKNASLCVKAQLPVWEDVNGIQLVTDYSILTSISYSF